MDLLHRLHAAWKAFAPAEGAAGEGKARSMRGLGPAGFHRIAYRDWGRAHDTVPVICVHGLTRNSRDFDVLATALARQGRRVLCPDVVGRGESDRLADAAGYNYQQYLADAAALIAHSGAAQVDWVGTSMGGLIGMMLAALPGAPIRRLVVNDVGPLVPAAALRRIGSYVTADSVFADHAEAEAHLRRIHAPFGPMSDAQWRDMARHATQRDGEGRLRLAYDPQIGTALKYIAGDVDLWATWDRIAVPTLVIRGAESDLLRRDTADAMGARGPRARIVEMPGCGHAPSLTQSDQIAPILDHLREAAALR
jgi:pimeloyl-ACP methyl ester carboxylesterase